MDDATIESIINAVVLTTSVRTLRSLSFVGLDSEVDRPSRIPKTIASSFPNLNSLDITYNQIRLIESGSLAFASTQQILKLDLRGIQVENIEPGAFEGDFTNAKIYLSSNPLNRFDADVFKKMLQQMTSGVGKIDFSSYGSQSRCFSLGFHYFPSLF